MAPELATGTVSARYFSFPGPCKFRAKLEVAIASLCWINSAGESRESLGPSSCCCFRVNRIYVGLQSVSQVTCPGSKKIQLSYLASLVWHCESGFLLHITKGGKSGCNPALKTPLCLLHKSHEESLAEGMQQSFAAPNKWELGVCYGAGRALWPSAFQLNTEGSKNCSNT